MLVNIPYGRGEIQVELPDERVKAVIKSDLDNYKAIADPTTLVSMAIENPIGSVKLRDLAADKDNVVVIASDHTRPVPSKVIMPLLLDEIRRRNPGVNITILIATGSHRRTTDEELKDKFGQRIASQEKIVVHDAEDIDNMVEIGTLPSGSPLVLNRIAVEADLLVAEGFIEPHFFAGYSGGRKSLMPGVASRKTVHANHCSKFIADENCRCGILDGNPIHLDMLRASEIAGLKFIVNVVLNSKQQVIGAFAGDQDLAHREGVKFLDGMCRSEPVPADIVIVSNNGYPLDQNIYQTVKGMTTAEATCKEGGVIIMVAKCEDGIGGDVFYRSFKESRSIGDLMEKLLAVPADETIADQWQSQILARILMRFKVILVSDAPENVVRDMHMIPAKTVEQAVKMADKLLGYENGSITVIPEGISNIIC